MKTRAINLFWDTRRLTQAREDHLTYFVAAALDADPAFRRAYGDCLLASLAVGGVVPQIDRIETPAEYREHKCRPDLRLTLTDKRQVLIEHKLDAPETPGVDEAGEATGQLVRYLALPVDAVAYVRPSIVSLTPAVLDHPRYLRPAHAVHFQWRDLYAPLARGEHVLSTWLRDGFERLGFTPPVPHVGELWPQSSDEVIENQRNFAKLWHATRNHAASHWKVHAGSRCELYLWPLEPRLTRRVYISPLAQGGSLLRFRVETDEARLPQVRALLEEVASRLPVEPQIETGRLPLTDSQRERSWFCDLLAPLRMIVGDGGSAADHDARLYAQVVPLLDALVGGT